MSEEEKKELLVTYSVRLRKDQVGFLKNIKDAADFIRRALDAAILSYSTKPEEHEILALNRRRIELQKQIEKIKQSEEYRSVMDQWSEMTEFRQRLEKYEKMHLLSQAVGKLRAETSLFRRETEESAEYKVFHPSNPALYITVKASTPDEAIRKAEEEIEKGLDLEIDMRTRKEYEFLKRTKQAYEEEIARLEKEIQEIKSKVIQ